MEIFDNLKIILAETFSAPTKDSFVTIVDGKRISLREGGNYKNANLRGANLRGAHLERINLEGADLTGAILENAHLKGANLKHAKLVGAVVSGADFTGVTLDAGGRVLRGAKASVPPIGVTVIGVDENGD